MVFKPDLSLIGTLSSENTSTQHHVIVAEFKRAGKALCYLAAKHVVGLNNPTTDAIESSIDTFKPDAIIIESRYGQENAGYNAGYVAHIKEQAQSGFLTSREDRYAAHLAIENDIPFIGAEPSDQEIISGMNKHNYSTKDVLAFYLLRQIPVWHEQGTLDKNDFPKQAEELLQIYHDQLNMPVDERLSFDEFKRWFDEHNTTGKSFLEFENDDLRPINSDDASYFKKLNYALDPIREAHIVQVIADTLEKYNRVLVVYGQSHLIKSQPVFEKMFESAPHITAIRPVGSVTGSTAEPATDIK